MSGLPFTAKGSTGEITFTGSEVLIRRTGVLGALSQFSGRGRGNKDIPLSAVTGIRLEPGSLMNKPFIQIIHSGSLETQGGASAAAQDDNSVFFSKGVTGDFERLKSLILEAIRMAKVQPQASQPAAPAAEDLTETLKKLSGLKDAGVISEEEFAAKKAEILARL
ncbi:SHOCT domain-containing protein [Pseudomonas protegens]|uniref:SHOCT domain-containing protein n=1 Tax=Pseudomonas protegens TaxID=380021 RepID=UPI001B32D972|nr:SHOCT domain-containing protein [Pseudomonas protegens]MBP5123383.1 SHOCT domain-containing protein [Pseudomonas protegens]